MKFIDTNVLVRLITRDDARQTALADAYIRSGVWVSVLALAETSWVLSATYNLRPREIGTAFQMLLDHPDLVLQHREAVAAAVDLFRAKPALGFSDCLVLQLARAEGHIPFGTCDRALAKIEGSAETVAHPFAARMSEPRNKGRDDMLRQPADRG